MAIIPTQQDYDMLQQSIRDLQVKIELLNFNFQIVDNIEGNLIDGTLNIDANQDIRRTCNLSLIVTDSSFDIQQGGKIWLDKYIRIYIGYTDIITKTVRFWNMGIFMINNPHRQYDSVTNTLSFEGIDLMAKLTGKRNGQLEALTTVIPAGTNIKEAVIATITQLGGFTNYVIDDIDETVPYDIKVESTSFVYDILATLRDLYSNWEMFFDIDGVFNFKRIPTGVNSAVVLDFSQLETNINITDNIDVNFENVKNRITVWGRLLDDGTQIVGRSADYYETSPYKIDSIGKINYVITDERIYTNELATERANYELYLHSRMNDAINIEVVPIYWLNDVNECIKLYNENIGISDNYLIKSISLSLSIEGTMSINAIKIYDESSLPEAPRPQVYIYGDTNINIQNCPFELFIKIEGEDIISDIKAEDITISDTILSVNPTVTKLSEILYSVSFPGYPFGENFSISIASGVCTNLYGQNNLATEPLEISFVKPGYDAYYINYNTLSETDALAYIDFGYDFNIYGVTDLTPWIFDIDFKLAQNGNYNKILFEKGSGSNKIGATLLNDSVNNPTNIVLTFYQGATNITINIPRTYGGNTITDLKKYNLKLQINADMKIDLIFRDASGTGYNYNVKNSTVLTNALIAGNLFVSGTNSTDISLNGLNGWNTPIYRIKLAGKDSTGTYKIGEYDFYNDIGESFVTDVHTNITNDKINALINNSGIVAYEVYEPKVILQNRVYSYFTNSSNTDRDMYMITVTPLNGTIEELNIDDISFDPLFAEFVSIEEISYNSNPTGSWLVKLRAIQYGTSEFYVKAGVITPTTGIISNEDSDICILEKVETSLLDTITPNEVLLGSYNPPGQFYSLVTTYNFNIWTQTPSNLSIDDLIFDSSLLRIHGSGYYKTNEGLPEDYYYTYFIYVSNVTEKLGSFQIRPGAIRDTVQGTESNASGVISFIPE